MTELHCNDLNDWIETLADAAECGNEQVLDQLDRISHGWLQSNREADIQFRLVNAVRGLIQEANY